MSKMDQNMQDKLREIHEAYSAQKQDGYDSQQHACPNCGYCPHCGRGGQWVSPNYPSPYYYYPYGPTSIQNITWTSYSPNIC